MYRRIEDQEKNPDRYVLAKIDPSMTEDECFDFLTNPRQTQRTLGLYLKKVKEPEESTKPDRRIEPEYQEKRFSLYPGSHHLERQVMRNKGFWVEKPQISAPLTYKLREKYSIQIPAKTRRQTGLFQAPDPVKPEETLEQSGPVLSSRIPTGCQCNTYGEHGTRPDTWDFPFTNEMDMIRQHEMNKVLKPYKGEILNQNYTKRSPIRLIEKELGIKKKFPMYGISNL